MRGLDELDRVDWQRLDHAYGDAGDVPDLLRSLHDEDAVGELVAALCHQGVRFSASAAAVPYLAGIALDTGEVPPLMLLGFLAIGDDDAYAFPRPPEADGAMDPDAVAAYQAVRAEVPALLPLLAHADLRTAATAAWLVSWFPALAAQTLPAVRASRPTTTVTIARGLLGDRTVGPGGWAEAVAALCAGDTDWAVDAVLAAARRLGESDLVDEDLPYLGGDVAGVLASALRLLPPERRSEAIATVRILADRAKPPFATRLRTMRDAMMAG
ncbi:hypothetical protein E1258_26750 [Micromonospora sp. KC207]|uniref:hypothetical protein n=1 Tax=Micromonospora sp. KC207 TaxID=2530377 RepID=UPI001049C80B|nr:hypothetical protein [Micromonospora sp. KC207]TDC50052.1 hypothetical protein E1258_26750 [Micromonospora sp. KC207]